MTSLPRSVDQALIKPEKPHAIVIGSGFGGLAAAVRLGARNYNVTVLEKLDKPGGRAYVYKQDGFTFDAGPTIITAPFLLEELWELCGRNFKEEIDLRLMKPYYQIRFDDGETFNYSGNIEQTKEEIRKFNPDDVAGYERYLKMSERIFKVGFQQLGHVPFNSFTDMLRIIPDMLTLHSYKTVYGMVSKFIRDKRLRIVLSFHPLLIGGNPLTATSIYSLISFLELKWGVHSVMGGTCKLVNGLASLIKQQGNQIQCNSEVQRILIDNKKAVGVELKNGETIKADVVVSNADAAWTYKNLLPENLPRHWNAKRVEKANYSNGLFVWYFGTKRTYPDVKHHTIALGPRYQGLLNDIFKHKILAKDFSLYLHRPTATDPSLAPDGCDSFYVLSPVPNLAADIDWKKEAEPYRQAIEKHLSETILPDLKNQLVTSFVTTPLDFQNRLLSYRGAGFSLEPLLRQSAWFRPHNKCKDIKNLFFVGAGTHPGAGVPGVLSSAKVLDTVIPDAKVYQHAN